MATHYTRKTRSENAKKKTPNTAYTVRCARVGIVTKAWGTRLRDTAADGIAAVNEARVGSDAVERDVLTRSRGVNATIGCTSGPIVARHCNV